MANGERRATDTVLDLRGLKCPLPVLKLKRRIARVGAGARIVAVATDAMAAVDIPHFCREAGHLLIGQTREGETLRFEIEVGTPTGGRTAPRIASHLQGATRSSER